MIAYFLVFHALHCVTVSDYIIMIINPIGFTAIFLTLSLFIKRKKYFYIGLLIFTFLGSLLVYANVLYYREFTDYLTINTLVGGAGMVGKGFAISSIASSIVDIIYWIDIIVFALLIIFKKINVEEEGPTKIRAVQIFSFSVLLFALNFWWADYTEHQLVSRQAQYDDTYVVRYLGLGPWLATNGYYTHLSNKSREVATKTDFTKVEKYIQGDRYLAPNVKMYGIAKNRNVIEIHLESLQQDMIDLSIKGADGKEHVVTPFLNSLYHSDSTYAFSNFFNQVGQGKTSDAENMLETSTFGLSSGSLFSSLGSSQTFQAMPAILNQQAGYSSAVFHGNVGSFYNRNNTYRQMGYQNFFDQSYWDMSGTRGTEWGIKDKLLFNDSVPWLEQLQQPFYAKYLTVSNHTPYTIDKEDMDPNFSTVSSGNYVVDNYFVTAHYLDQSVQEFYNYLKKSGLYDRSIIVLYGDHYGISGSDTKVFAPYVGYDPNNFTDYDNTMMQRVPFMINIPGHTDGYISDEYAGEIDVMPTIEHLLGVDTKNYMQFGQDIFADHRQQFIALRNGGFVTPTITAPSRTNNVYYDTKTEQIITPNAEQEKYIQSIKAKVDQLLAMSDLMNTENLLRFYTPQGFTPIKSGEYNYTETATEARLKDEEDTLKAKSTSLLSEHQGISTINQYQTNAPEANSKDEKELLPPVPSKK